MSDPKLNRLLHRSPVRVSVGFLAGLFFGPLIAFLLILAPSSEWLGPYPAYMEDCAVIPVAIGVFCGPIVGLVVALLALSLQQWQRGRSRPDSGLWRSESEKPPDQQAREIKGDVRISRQTDIADRIG